MEALDLEIGYKQLVKQRRQARVLQAYYDGDHPQIYTHERLNEVFGTRGTKFIMNWSCVVIDSALDRMVFKGWDSTNEQENKTLDQVYKSQKIQKLSRKVHKDSLVTGDGFIMFDKVDGETKAYWNSPELLTVIYEDDDDEKMAFALKVWEDTRQGVTKLNLYYPDKIYKYEAKKPSSHKAFALVEEVPNAFGQVPVVHFKADTLELANILSLQNAINKTFGDMMVVGEFGAFPQRWILTNADIESLKSSPASIMSIPKGTEDEEGTQVGQFQSANLQMYLETMDKLANSIAIITRTPKHYLMNTGANLSGEALKAMEAPLVKKVNQYVENYSENWIQVAGYYQPDTSETVTVWDSVETDQPETKARTMEVLKRIGLPLVTLLKRFGWGEDEITQMNKDKAEETQAQAELSAQAFDLARTRLQANNDVTYE